LSSHKKPEIGRSTIETNERPDDKQLLDRLRRIEGQIRGLQRMIEEQRDCSDTIVQVLAIRSALEQVGVKLLDQQLHNCFSDDDVAGIDLAPLKKSLRMWVKFGAGS
jgi:DNA-binding FrmR family transcriptional regulator